MPLLYVTPATLLFCLLMLFPMVMVIRYSLMDGAIVKKNAGFAGLQNYRAVFADPVFWESVGQHALLHRDERDLPPADRPRLRAAAELDRGSTRRSGASCGCSSSCRGCSPR